MDKPSTSSEPKRWKYRIRHVLEAIAACRAYVAGMTQEQFGEDRRTLHAVAWELMSIGEAARHIPALVSAAFPEVPWALMRGMRNRIVHGYDRIQVEIVWDVVTVDLPPLVPHLERIEREGVE
jgi:uncharacterized protein with HEPN domain